MRHSYPDRIDQLSQLNQQHGLKMLPIINIEDYYKAIS